MQELASLYAAYLSTNQCVQELATLYAVDVSTNQDVQELASLYAVDGVQLTVVEAQRSRSVVIVVGENTALLRNCGSAH